MLYLFFTCHIFVSTFHVLSLLYVLGYFVICKLKDASGYIFTYGTACWFHIIINSLFTLPDTDSDTDSDSDSKPDGYMVRCKICSHCTDSNSDSYLDSDPQLLLYQILGRISEPGLGCISTSDSVNKP